MRLRLLFAVASLLLLCAPAASARKKRRWWRRPGGDKDALGRILNAAADEDHYRVLGVKVTATPAEMDDARKRLALLVHPDKVPADDRHRAEAAFIALQEACVAEVARRGSYRMRPAGS